MVIIGGCDTLPRLLRCFVTLYVCQILSVNTITIPIRLPAERPSSWVPLTPVQYIATIPGLNSPNIVTLAYHRKFCHLCLYQSGTNKTGLNNFNEFCLRLEWKTIPFSHYNSSTITHIKITQNIYRYF